MPTGMEATQVLIDSNCFIEHIRAKRKDATALAKVQEQRHQLITSSIVAAELFYGARTAAVRSAVQQVLFGIEIVAFTSQMASRISVVAEQLQRRSEVIGFRDLAIACCALTLGVPVATHNRSEFARVDGLRLFEMS